MSSDRRVSGPARIRGVILGGAIGDAFGAGVETLSLEKIRDVHGSDGITSYVPAYGRKGAWTDETQMVLFVVDGLFGMLEDFLYWGAVNPEQRLNRTLRNWYDALRSESGGIGPTGLYDMKAIHAIRNPDTAILGALGLWGRTGRPPQARFNSGAILVAAAPIATAVSASTDRFRDVVEPVCANETVLGAADVMCSLITSLGLGYSPERAVESSIPSRDDNAVLSSVLRSARDLALGGDPSFERVEELGRGWSAEQALAVAVYALLVGEDFDHSLRLAANHSGASDTTACLVGQLWGASLGDLGIPDRWLEDLEEGDRILQLANMIAAGYRPGESDGM